MHVVTLSFDDGFERSSIRTAEIFERYGLVAELNIVAAGHLGEPGEEWHRRWRKGDFGLWSELRARGHYVMPHGYRHANKAELPLDEAKRLIEACLDVFRAELDGFEASKASFAFPYNRSTAELEDWVVTRVRAFRTGGDPVMPLPRLGQQKTGAGRILLDFVAEPGHIDSQGMGLVEVVGPPHFIEQLPVGHDLAGMLN